MTRAWQIFSIAIIVGIATLFYTEGFSTAPSPWPIPLDDSYIYFAYARSLVLGDGMSWTSGGGYSSGATSLLYPLLLAPGYAFVHLLDAPHLMGLVAALVAVVGLYDTCRSLQTLAPRAQWLIAPALLCCPLLDWSLFSGMETALLCAVLARALRAVHESTRLAAHARPAAQRRAGLWVAALLMCRPELVPLAFSLGIASVLRARSLRTGRSLLRTLGPSAAWLAGIAALNLWLTGEAAAAGALRKVIWYDPFLEHASAVGRVLINLVVVVHQGLVRGLGGPLGCVLLLGLAVRGALARRQRHLAMPLLLGAFGTLALIAQNETARYQNFRYVTPSLIMLLFAAILGMDESLRTRGPRRRMLTAAICSVALLIPLLQELRLQTRHFATASRNISEQQAEVARRLAAMSPPPRRVLVGDAGAIPFLSNLPAIDGLGLGGFKGLPFARASRHGPAAVVELIERLPPSERPDLMALYPNWWQGLADVFGHPIDRVRIEDNVICASDEKVIYRADWATLAPTKSGTTAPPDGQQQEVDIADIVSEDAHRYVRPLHRGWLTAATRMLPGSQQARRDAGRIIPAGSSESFTVLNSFQGGACQLRLRTDRQLPPLRVRVIRRAELIEERVITAPPPNTGEWSEPIIEFSDVRAADRVQLHALGGEWRNYHLWLTRSESSSETIR